MVVEAEGEPQVGVRADVIADHPARPLSGEQEVHSQAPTSLRDVDQSVQHIGLLSCQRGELVHHHHEARHDGATEPSPQRRQVGRSVCTEQLLACRQLGAQAAQHPFGQRRIEVGHHPDHVGQPDEGVEGSATLVVDEHERELVGRHRATETEDEAAQELTLAGTRGARHQSVRAVADEVDIDDAVACHADRGDRCCVGGAGIPGRGDRCRVTDVDPAFGEERRQRHDAGQAGVDRGEVLGIVQTQEASAPPIGRGHTGTRHPHDDGCRRCRHVGHLACTAVGGGGHDRDAHRRSRCGGRA